MSEERVQHKSSGGIWLFVIIVVIIGWLLFSQSKDKADYNKALRVTGARVECRAEAKREGWSDTEANCNKLGTPGYEMSTDSYFNAYRQRTGAKEL